MQATFYLTKLTVAPENSLRDLLTENLINRKKNFKSFPFSSLIVKSKRLKVAQLFQFLFNVSIYIHYGMMAVAEMKFSRARGMSRYSVINQSQFLKNL